MQIQFFLSKNKGLHTECRKVHIRHFFVELRRFGVGVVRVGAGMWKNCAEMAGMSHLTSAQIVF